MSAIVLSDDVLNGLLARNQGLPCLQFLQAAKAHKPCNCARDPKLLTRQIEGEHARICVFQLPPESLAILKKALGAEQLVLYMTTPGFPKRSVL